MSEQKRTAQISPDRLAVGFFAISLVIIVMASSMVFSYVGIAEAASWTGVPFGIHVIAPIFIDGAIITYTVSLTIFEWRREDAKTVRHTKRVLRGFTLLSVVLNFAHTASYWQWDFTAYEAWFGSLISISAPIAALLSAEEVVRLAFRRRRASDAPADEGVPEAAPAVVAVTAPAETAPAVAVPELAPVAPAAVPAVEVAPAPEPLLPVHLAEPDPVPPDVIAEAEHYIHGDDLESAPAAEPDGIVRYPVQGEVLISAIDRASDIDRAF